MSKIVVPIQKFSQEIGKMQEKVCFVILKRLHFCNATFDLWMFHGTHDVFVLEINF
jgi:hypothetical protein